MSRQRLYWDSDCFLGWLQAEVDKQEACRGVLEEARDGNIQIITSALTLAEVLAIRGRPKMLPDKRIMVEQFFKHDYIAVQNLTRRLAEAARELVWDHGIAPKDAIHVATAIATNVAALHTFDANLIKKSGAVASSPLVICRPFVKEPRLDLRQSGIREDGA